MVIEMREMSRNERGKAGNENSLWRITTEGESETGKEVRGEVVRAAESEVSCS